MSAMRLGVLLCLLLAAARGLSLDPNPFVVVGWDTGRDNDDYYLHPLHEWGSTRFQYQGAVIQPGLTCRLDGTPLLAGVSLLKGFPPEAPSYYQMDSVAGFYGAAEAGGAFRAGAGKELLVEAAYLTDLASWRHSVTTCHVQWGTVSKGANWSLLAGGAYEVRRYGTLRLRRPLLLGAAGVTFSRWFIQPYLDLAYVYKLSTEPYDYGPWIHPPKLAGFVSVGLRLQSGASDLSALVHRMTAPKGWRAGGPE